MLQPVSDDGYIVGDIVEFTGKRRNAGKIAKVQYIYEDGAMVLESDTPLHTTNGNIRSLVKTHPQEGLIIRVGCAK
jgi:hypothetical protein